MKYRERFDDPTDKIPHANHTAALSIPYQYHGIPQIGCYLLHILWLWASEVVEFVSVLARALGKQASQKRGVEGMRWGRQERLQRKKGAGSLFNAVFWKWSCRLFFFLLLVVCRNVRQSIAVFIIQ
jgi:hypothetical protein